ncbi:hypothetical protein K1T71_006035 [Dendrolimus kikuchii]|uniref:Uncharacterized protein n=1 Tax=Dendrolimus kikuchii TaxID=765133 RepID=A0ACC1D3U7_9NEOP|nr:hypothetical protein K1T71_006035 [Dendrolimus kikuchii]
MGSSELEMSLEHQILIKKTQMNGDCAGTQCGLTSLLPMSCREGAAAFARDLHSRLRNLGGTQEDECESSWLTRDNGNHRPTTSAAQRDLDTFYDFELVCESPSSPVDEIDVPFSERLPTDDQEAPFYDVDSETDIKEEAKLLLQQSNKAKNGFKFSTVFYTDSIPVKRQPVSQENGHAEKRLYSPITFEGCARQNSRDEVDFVVKEDPESSSNHINSSANVGSSTIDSDSEFETAKSESFDGVDEVSLIANRVENDFLECEENVSLIDVEIPIDEEPLKEEIKEDFSYETGKTIQEPLKIITSEICIEKESSPFTEIEPSLLSVEEKEEDQNETEDDRPQRVRRCSSLKTGKTPPGTPGRKKIVRFADVLGLDLADVKTFMDEIPVVPKSAYDDLTGCDVSSSPPVRTPPRLGALTLVPLFQLPRDVSDKLEKQNVCMESARVCDGVHVTICGSVRVRNLDFHKTVHVRYTMNRWKTYTDLQTSYVQGSCDGYSDRFQFVLYAPAISSGQRLELAVRFQCKGQQFWDNNSGANYCFDCLALGASANVSSPVTSGPLHPTVDWHPSFY